eukprot:CAMPEP_0174306546 /NCGR_PEP_ID=MMETSP0810-20121108/523_1 /TAXON_ID=73025 ORGANISM="Eutreptiella gymnastica-like, Strain CCMP1594" /NCGR_SAMPLE_ID=MMETSP0810 /ASSEMBLY_ACC=CAM_ASM_000659 /LENGTH=282 /DNA_ID=CAMNT_0015413297 /DNA_START=246 /DNA_END=1090 /DNA_ORIENTATION=-
MTVVFIFVLATLRQRLSRPTKWQRYGPLVLVGLAIPLIVADLWRHVLQDAALTRMDLLSLALVWAACGAYIIATMAFTQKPWGPFSVPRSAFLTSRHFQHVPMLLVLLAVVSSTVGRTTSGWFGATRLTWPECGDAPPFSRVNKTWTDDCLWSSSQYKCENVCCVPGGDGSAGIVNVSQLPNGECTCSCIPNDKENMRHLSPLGVCFTLVFTYAGFVLLAIGTLWNASIVSKLGEIRRQWRALQGVEMGVGAQPPRAPYDPLPAAPMDTAVVDFKYDVVVVG